MAKEENLAILGDEIGIYMELRSTGAKTGSFSTDIWLLKAILKIVGEIVTGNNSRRYWS